MMNTVLSLLCVLLVCISFGHSRPSRNRWDARDNLQISLTGTELSNKARSLHVRLQFPCNGALKAQEVICGFGDGKKTPPVITIETSPQQVNVSTPESVEKKYGGGQNCVFDDMICSVGLMEDLCGDRCQDRFSISGKTLSVGRPCKGLFLVTLCKEW